MIHFSGCEDLKHDSMIALHDKGSKNPCKFYLQNVNHKEIQIVYVDGCVVKQGERCDYLVLHESGNQIIFEIFIELKGSDVKKAISQLITTMKLLKNDQSLKRYCYIVVKNHCPMRTTKMQEYQEIFKKYYNSTLKVEKNSGKFIV